MPITLVTKRRVVTHVRLNWLKRGLRVEWGSVHRLTFKPSAIEVLLFSEFPELSELYDGVGWNLDALRGLVDNAEGTALPEAVTVLLTQFDVNLLSEAGFALEAG